MQLVSVLHYSSILPIVLRKSRRKLAAKGIPRQYSNSFTHVYNFIYIYILHLPWMYYSLAGLTSLLFYYLYTPDRTRDLEEKLDQWRLLFHLEPNGQSINLLTHRYIDREKIKKKQVNGSQLFQTEFPSLLNQPNSNWHDVSKKIELFNWLGWFEWFFKLTNSSRSRVS